MKSECFFDFSSRDSLIPGCFFVSCLRRWSRKSRTNTMPTALWSSPGIQRIATYLATSQTYHHHTPWGPKYKERSSCIVVSAKDCWNLASSCWVMLWILRYLIQQMLFLFQIEFHDILPRSTKYIILHVWKPKRFKRLWSMLHLVARWHCFPAPAIDAALLAPHHGSWRCSRDLHSLTRSRNPSSNPGLR